MNKLLMALDDDDWMACAGLGWEVLGGTNGFIDGVG